MNRCERWALTTRRVVVLSESFYLARKLLYDDRGVVTAESETVAHRVSDLPLLGDVWRIVQIAIRIWSIQIDRWWNHAVLNRLDAKNQFQSAAGSQRVANLALGTADTYLLRVIAKDLFDGNRFCFISQWCTGSVGVDVIDLVGI